MASTRHVFVTGASAGIGLEIVRALGTQPGYTVWALVRDLSKGRAAVAACAASASTVQLWPAAVDLEDETTLIRLASDVAAWGQPLHALVNNAGFAYHGDTFGPSEARKTMAINAHGTAGVTRAVLPALLKAVGSGATPRVINMCSIAGRLGIVSPPLQTRFARPDATPEEALALGDEFVAAVAAGDYAEKGWPRSMYGVSKLTEIAWSYALARQLAREGVVVHAVCPGHCATAMSSFTGARSAAKGAETPVWLVTRDETSHPPVATTGGLWRDMALMAW